MPPLVVRMPWSTSYTYGMSDAQPPGGRAWWKGCSPALIVKQGLYQEVPISDLLYNSLILKHIFLPYADPHAVRLEYAL
jgi:hypothetical protein